MIAVTGASGLIGGNLVRRLLADGRQVRALVHHDRRALDGLPVESMPVDLLDQASLARDFAGAEVVYHCAGAIILRMDSWAESAAVNIEGTRNVLAACKQAGVRRLVYFSSVHVHAQEPFDQPLDEERPFISDPRLPPYERSKVEGDRLVMAAVEAGMDVVTIAPTAVLGPFDFRPSYIGQAVRMLASGRIPALVDGGYDWVDVRDVVEGSIAAELGAPTGRRYLLGGHWHSVREVAALVAECSGVRAPRLTVPLALAEWAEPVMGSLAHLNGSEPLYTRAMLHALRSNHHISWQRAATELGYRPRPLKETIADTLRWFAENI